MSWTVSTAAGVLVSALIGGAAEVPAEPAMPEISTLKVDRIFQALPSPADGSAAQTLGKAAELLGAWTLHIGDIDVDGALLAEIVEQAQTEPLLRVVRERLRQPIDLPDFLLFLDDVLAAEGRMRGQRVWVPPGRARSAGINLHPHDVFWKDRPRRYADGYDTLNIDKPPRQTKLLPADNGDLLGPNWTARFKNPHKQQEMIDALRQSEGAPEMTSRMVSLKQQLKAQGADVWITSTVRSRERGYLMWGAFYLSRAESRRQLYRRLARVQKRNRQWGLNIPIAWNHPEGWRATVDAARAMTDTYDVVYATERGAKNSDHYDGVAFDIVGRALPRSLTLTAPDGTEKTFDLSDANQSRDLSLSPQLISWVEKTFRLKKLKGDYPHWGDAGDDLPGTPLVAERDN